MYSSRKIFYREDFRLVRINRVSAYTGKKRVIVRQAVAGWNKDSFLV